MDDEPDLCAICMDPLANDERDLIMPGCRHRFHVACALNACQYNAHCAVCRQPPAGVQVREQEHPRTIFFSWDLSTEEEADRATPDVWARYRRRRRRCLNQNPSLLRMYDELRAVRTELQREDESATREWERRAREIWRTDSVVRGHLNARGRLRRRERRLERRLCEELRQRIGDEPE